LLLLAVLGSSSAQRALGRYNVDPKAVSTSGISSGASMAIQMHVAYSSRFMGVGSIAGSAYWCAKGSLLTALNACMSLPAQVNVAELRTQTNTYANAGDIDATINMRDDRVYIFAGTRDTTVVPGESQKIDEYYRSYINALQIKTEYSIVAAHTQPTIDYGNACATAASPYISKCNYNGAYELLNWIYGGNLQRPGSSVPLVGDFYEFDQREFFYISAPSVSSMDTVGFVYVPSNCINSQIKCRLHVAFHGCVMGRHAIRDVYARNAGYNEVGELNNIIILYPQAISSAGSNPNGCWDWWGYTIPKYATKGANQPLATIRMVDKVMGPIVE